MVRFRLFSIGILIGLALQANSQERSIRKDTAASYSRQYLAFNPEASAVLLSISFAGDSSWYFAEGVTRQKGSTSATSSNRFMAASITKTFVATVILKLEEEGRLALSDLANTYLDSEMLRSLTTYKGRSYEEKITIENLLRHTSGIQDYLNEGKVHLNGYENDPYKKYVAHERVDLAVEMGEAVSKPGKYHYSNTNYILLGMIAEQILKKDIATILNEYIFDPLSLGATTLAMTEQDSVDMIHGYYTDWDLTRFVLNFNRMNAAGGLLTNQKDLITFMHALFRGELFQKSGTLSKMLDFQKGYGLGVLLYEKSAKLGRVYGHSGFDPGYTTYLAYIESRDICIIATINQSELRVQKPAFLIYKLVQEFK